MTPRRSGKDWVRREFLAVLYFYVAYKKELTTPQNHPLTKKLADSMERTDGSISKRIQNYKSVDPAYPGRGLEGGDSLCIRIWREYEANPDRVLTEARRAYREFVSGTYAEETKDE